MIEFKIYIVGSWCLHNDRYGYLKRKATVFKGGITTYEFISFRERTKEDEIKALKNSIATEEEREIKTGSRQGGLEGKRLKLYSI